jgi:hypothetical protein
MYPESESCQQLDHCQPNPSQMHRLRVIPQGVSRHSARFINEAVALLMCVRYSKSQCCVGLAALGKSSFKPGPPVSRPDKIASSCSVLFMTLGENKNSATLRSSCDATAREREVPSLPSNSQTTQIVSETLPKASCTILGFRSSILWQSCILGVSIRPSPGLGFALLYARI